MQETSERRERRQRREIIDDPAFREKLRGEDHDVLFDFLAAALT